MCPSYILREAQSRQGPGSYQNQPHKASGAAELQNRKHHPSGKPRSSSWGQLLPQPTSPFSLLCLRPLPNKKGLCSPRPFSRTERLLHRGSTRAKASPGTALCWQTEHRGQASRMGSLLTAACSVPHCWRAFRRGAENRGKQQHLAFKQALSGPQCTEQGRAGPRAAALCSVRSGARTVPGVTMGRRPRG